MSLVRVNRFVVELVQAAGWGRGSNLQGADLNTLAGSHQQQMLHSLMTRMSASTTNYYTMLKAKISTFLSSDKTEI